MKRIWIFEHYAAPESLGHFTRQANFSKQLTRMGYDVLIFSASTIHNSDLNVTEEGKPYVCRTYPDGVRFVHIRCRPYKGNGKARVLNMLDFYFGLAKAVRNFEKPDVIYASMPHFFTCLRGLQLAKRYSVPCVCEVRDFWPETFVAMGMAKASNPVIKLLYGLEKYIYAKADALVFTLPGCRDYIMEKGYDTAHGGPVDLAKVHHINNGVDLAAFDRHAAEDVYADEDLADKAHFKVIYTGSLGRANHMDLALEAAKLVSDARVRFLIYGAGNCLDALKARAEAEGIGNVIFKGRVEKKYVPSILSRADATFFILEQTALYRFGASLNKSFEYLAAGKPLLALGNAEYSPVRGGGIEVRDWDAESFARALEALSQQPEQCRRYGEAAREIAGEFDFRVLSARLAAILEGVC